MSEAIAVTADGGPLVAKAKAYAGKTLSAGCVVIYAVRGDLGHLCAIVTTTFRTVDMPTHIE